MSNKVIVLIGFSCCGKDSIQSALNNVGFKIAVSHTTRPMRGGEKQGREYHFVSKEIFDDMSQCNDFAGSPRSYNTLLNGIPQTWYYGLSKRELNSGKNMVTILDLQGAEALKKELGDKMIGIFIDVDEDERLERCIRRGDYNGPEWHRRAEDDRRIFKDAKKSNAIDFWVKNYNFETCMGEIYRCVGLDKIAVYFDVDGCIIKTLDIMAKYYNHYQQPEKEITANDITSWNAKEAMPEFEPEDIEEIFKSDFFWKNVMPYDGVIKMIKTLHMSGKFDIIPTSIGSSQNIAFKTMYLNRVFPFLTNQIMLVKNNGCHPGKQIIDMSNGVIVDDSQTNLFTSNAKYKVLCAFDGDKEWNKDWNLDDCRADTVDELYEIVMRIADKEFAERKIQETIDKCC